MLQQNQLIRTYFGHLNSSQSHKQQHHISKNQILRQKFTKNANQVNIEV